MMSIIHESVRNARRDEAALSGAVGISPEIARRAMQWLVELQSAEANDDTHRASSSGCISIPITSGPGGKIRDFDLTYSMPVCSIP